MNNPKVGIGGNNRLPVIDLDIHPRVKRLDELKPYLSAQWWDHVSTFGLRKRQGYLTGQPYPKNEGGRGQRGDSYPSDGTHPGSDLPLMQQQHLDLYNIDYGVLQPLRTGQDAQNIDLSAAMCSAYNDWQLDYWTRREKRLRGSILVPYEDGEASKAEIRKRADEKDFVQILMMSRGLETYGKKRYWPIYEAACEADLPVAIHVFGDSGWPATNSGWPSYYIEETAGLESACSAMLVSMVCEGVFERFPQLRLVIVEAGFAWLPAVSWRLDKHWKRLKAEVPHLKKLPSEYVREQVWVTTQPMEEPERRQDLMDIIQWIGDDRIMFASDYPHWDFDDPFRALPSTLGDQLRRKIFSGNAENLYRFN